MKIKALKEADPLYGEIEFWIDRIKNRKIRYASLYRGSKVLALLGGAAITILVGAKIVKVWGIESGIIILMISTSITVLVALEGLFDLKDKAKGYDVFLFELRRLRDKMSFDYVKDPKLYEQNKEGYFKRYQEILESQKLIIENSYEKGE